MRYRLMVLVGIATFAASVVAFCIGLTGLLEVGTCASGNQAFVIEKPCPDGTGTKVLLLTLSIFGLLLSAGLYGLRGRSPGGRSSLSSLPFLAGWALFFTVTGAVSMIHSLTSDTIPADAKMGGEIVGVIFLLMGVPALLFWAWSAIGALRDRGEPRSSAFGSTGGVDAASLRSFSKLASQLRSSRGSYADPFAAAPDPPSAGNDTLAQLERLQRLRAAGALSEAEFAEQKSRILRG